MLSPDEGRRVAWNGGTSLLRQTAQLTFTGGGDELARFAAKIERTACSRETRG